MRKLADFIWGAARGLVRRLRFYIGPQGLFRKQGSRRVIKTTGIGNCENRSCYYPSIYHFIHNMPCFFKRKRYDWLVAQNYLHEEFMLFPEPKLFLSMEPLQCLTPETRENMRSVAMKPFLYLYDEPNINKRMFYPALGDDRERIIRQLEERITEKRTKLCCIINRYSEHPELNLLKQRVHFVRVMGKDIDIYGAEPWGGRPNRWTEYSNYRGAVKNKRKTLQKYNFVIAFENNYYPGYITEKIIDAFKAGTVPLYWGGGEYLKETLPTDSYIDCKEQDPERIYHMIKNMQHEDIVLLRKAAIEFLKSNSAERFTGFHLRQEIINKLSGMKT